MKKLLCLTMFALSLAGCQKKTWTQFATVEASRPVQELLFADKEHGWLLAGGSVGFTADAGKKVHWAKASDKDLNAVCFPTATDGWAVGEGETIVHSKDSGNTWEVQHTGEAYAHLGAVEFLDPNTGWVAGRSGVLATSDGGQHWSKSRLVGANRGFECLDFFVRPQGKSFAVGRDGLYAVSENAGQTWTAQPLTGLGARDDLQKITFVDEQVGWMVGLSVSPQNSDLMTVLTFLTQDGGQTWTNQPCSLTSPVEKVLALSAKEAWMVTRKGVFHTTDGGNTYTQDDPAEQVKVTALSLPEPNLVYLTTAKGVLYRAESKK